MQYWYLETYYRVICKVNKIMTNTELNYIHAVKIEGRNLMFCYSCYFFFKCDERIFFCVFPVICARKNKIYNKNCFYNPYQPNEYVKP